MKTEAFFVEFFCLIPLCPVRKSRHSGESQSPLPYTQADDTWIPVFAGMTDSFVDTTGYDKTIMSS